MRLIWTNWQHPTGFLPADLMHKCGQGVSAPWYARRLPRRFNRQCLRNSRLLLSLEIK